MSKRKQYTPEFQREAVSLVLEQNLSVAQAARDLGITESVLGRWVQKARGSQGQLVEAAVTESERSELKRLRAENSVLKREREILKKAAAFFARENL